MSIRHQNRWSGAPISKRAVQSASSDSKYRTVVAEFMASIPAERIKELDAIAKANAHKRAKPEEPQKPVKKSWQEMVKAMREYQPRPVRSMKGILG